MSYDTHILITTYSKCVMFSFVKDLGAWSTQLCGLITKTVSHQQQNSRILNAQMYMHLSL